MDSSGRVPDFRSQGGERKERDKAREGGRQNEKSEFKKKT
jgi:hypothetical protein